MLRRAAQVNGSSAEAFRAGRKHRQRVRGGPILVSLCQRLLGLRALEKAPYPVSRFS